MNIRKSRGITLISLVITVIVLIILAGISINMLIGKNGLLNKAEEAKDLTELTNIKTTLEIKALENQVNDIEHTQNIYMSAEEVSNILKIDKYKNKIGIYRNKVIFLAEENTEEEKYAKQANFEVKNMTPDEFEYYIELGILSDKVIEYNANNRIIGRELNTRDFQESITIGSNVYDKDWFLIGNYTEEEKNNNSYGSQFEELELKNTSHAPYIVKYKTGEVISIEGMKMYASQNKVHSFNLNGESNSILNKAIIYVDSMTEKNGTQYGSFNSTLQESKLYEFYADNEGLLQYDTDGALLLDEDNAIPYYPINQKYTIDVAYSISFTIQADFNQAKDSSWSATIVALSADNSKYISWIGVHDGFLNVYSFTDKLYSKNTVIEYDTEGFLSTNISEYSNIPVNVQVVAIKNGDTKLYINGVLKKTFKSGNLEDTTFDNVTIGDLRIGRNLKFTGKLYDFAIYGKALSEQEVQDNWNFFKR